MLYPKPNTQYPILSIIIKEPDSAKSLTEYCPIMHHCQAGLENLLESRVCIDFYRPLTFIDLALHQRLKVPHCLAALAF